MKKLITEIVRAIKDYLLGKFYLILLLFVVLAGIAFIWHLETNFETEVYPQNKENEKTNIDGLMLDSSYYWVHPDSTRGPSK